MSRIEITAAAYAALAASATNGLLEPQRSPWGGYFIWLDRGNALTRLKTARRSGEDYSDAITRLAREEGAT